MTASCLPGQALSLHEAHAGPRPCSPSSGQHQAVVAAPGTRQAASGQRNRMFTLASDFVKVSLTRCSFMPEIMHDSKSGPVPQLTPLVEFMHSMQACVRRTLNVRWQASMEPQACIVHRAASGCARTLWRRLSSTACWTRRGCGACPALCEYCTAWKTQLWHPAPPCGCWRHCHAGTTG